MKSFKTKLSMLVIAAALMVPTAVGAAEATTDPMKTPNVSTTPTTSTSMAIGETNIRGIYVPGIFNFNADTRIAYVLNGIGLVVVDKSTALPIGSYYIN